MKKFLIVGVFAGVVVGLVSLLWPKLTSQVRPVPLQQIHDTILGFQVGQQAAQTLGVTNDSAVAPVNPGQVVRSVVESVVTTVEHRTQQIVVENAVKQLSGQFSSLPQEKKQQIQAIICKP